MTTDPKHQPATLLPWQCSGELVITPGRLAATFNGSGNNSREDAQNAAYVAHAANAYPRLIAAMKRCIAGMPHSAPQEEAIALMRELGEIAPHR